MAEPANPKIYACCLDERIRKAWRLLPAAAGVAVVLAVVVGVPTALWAGKRDAWFLPAWFFWAGLILTAIRMQAPRRYELHPTELVVGGFGRAVAVSLPYSKVTSVEVHRPSPLAVASHLDGRRNLAGSTGYFHAEGIGDFEAWTTTMEYAVVIGRPVIGPLVISPESPEEFVAELQARVAAAAPQQLAHS